MIYTRQQYMSDASAPEAHRKFYAQLVSSSTVAHVVRWIGPERLLASQDEHLNDIGLSLWDRVAASMPKACKFSDVGDTPSLAGLVCVAKEAARQYIESRRKVQS